VDLLAHAWAEFSFSGTSVMKGRGKSAGKIEGEATFETKASGMPVTDLAAYRVKKPIFRENTHVFGGAQFKLPSCWMGMPQQERGVKLFSDSRSEDGTTVEVWCGDTDADPSDERFIEGFLKVARKEAPDVKVTKATFPTGEGFTFECTADTKQKVRGFVAPIGDGIIRFRMVGATTAVKKADPEFKALQASLAEAP
jgi:hypothetical protein